MRPKQFDYKNSASWRMFRIMGEFSEGFEFISSLKKAVTVFGSARLDPRTKWYKEAEKLGELLAKGNYDVVTGGGPGIMEAANRGAFGKHKTGDSVGLNIQLPREQRVNPYVERSIAFHYFFTRKVVMSFAANAFIYFPGGFGTLDELYEIVTLVQTGKIEPVPVILVGKDFWQPLIDFSNKIMVGKYKTLSKKEMNIIKLVNTAEEAYKIIQRYLRKNGKKDT